LGVSGDVPTPICGIDRKSGGKTAALQRGRAEFLVCIFIPRTLVLVSD